ncbi:MAG: hypothetical protein U0531_17050 [Dehalococcoidia bacterium]
MHYDPVAEAIVTAPSSVIDLPERDRRMYWLLRGSPGWAGAHEARYGGDPEDNGVATVRAVRFDTARYAERAFARLTPEYLHLALRDRMASPPEPFTYPEPLPGDQTIVYLYGVRLSPPYALETQLLGQLTAMRVGSAVVVVESIGVEPERLVPTFGRLARAAADTR